MEYGMAPVSIPLANYSLKIKELEEKKTLSVKGNISTPYW